MSDITPKVGDIVTSNLGTKYVVYSVGPVKMSIVSESGRTYPMSYDAKYDYRWIDTVERGGEPLEFPPSNVAEFGQVWESEYDEDCVIVAVKDDGFVVCHEGEGFTWEYDKTYFYDKYNLKEQA